MGTNPAFNLLDDPWIRVKDIHDKAQEVSLLELFERAAELRSIHGEIPTQGFAILRVALAFLHRALAPERSGDPFGDWSKLWQSERLPIPALNRYADQWRPRFELLDATAPFMQVADLHTSKNEFSPVAKIVAEVPDGSQFFTMRTGAAVNSLSLAEAARWLVHVQAFDYSGIKTGAVGDPRQKGGKGYPIGPAWLGRIGGVYAEGKTLKETLLYNLILNSESADLREQGPNIDLPAWERPPLGPFPEGWVEADGDSFKEPLRLNAPTGQIDLFTWQARRVRLVSGDGERITGVMLANGDRLAAQDCYHDEPMTAWRRSPTQEKALKQAKVYLPRTHDPARAMWRGVSGLLPRWRDQERDDLPPGVLRWIGVLADQELIASARSVRLRAVGMKYGSQAASVADVIDDALDLRALVLSKKGLAFTEAIDQAIQETDRAVRQLGYFAADLARAQGGEGAGVRNSIVDEAYFALDSQFRGWLAGLGEDQSAEDAVVEWRERAWVLVRDMGTRVAEQSGPALFSGRPAASGQQGGYLTGARAYAIFEGVARKALSSKLHTKLASTIHEGGHHDGSGD